MSSQDGPQPETVSAGDGVDDSAAEQTDDGTRQTVDVTGQ